MNSGNEFFLMNSFPDFHEPYFDINEYNKRFEKNNVIIHASSKDITYAEHWGALSVKCVIKGIEHYECSNRFYSVNEDHYLIFNEGQYYSSYIYSDTETESFTVNFSTRFLQCALQSFQRNLNDSRCDSSYEFIEKLYGHNGFVTPLLLKLYKASIVKSPDVHAIEEIYYNLFESLLLQQASLKKEIKQIQAVKNSTQVELYKRLNYAKDFIYSCYMQEISLNKLASVACMNNAYFLREFKKYFGTTPHQYIMLLRLATAKRLLETTAQSITEICFAIGYSDVSSFSKLFKKKFAITPAAYQAGNIKKSFFTC